MMPCGHEGATLMRFLKARKWHVGKAASMIQSTVQWRAEQNAAEALTTTMDDETEAKLRQCIPSGYIGYTKTGCPLKLEYTTKINIVDLLRSGITVDQYVFYHMRAMEYLMQVQFKEAANAIGEEVVDQQAVILDLSNLSMKMLNSTFFTVFAKISKMYQDNYPETMSMMFLVNIPSFFHAVWRLLSGAIDERVREKILFLRSRDLAALREHIDERYLPEHLGGCNPGEGGKHVNGVDGYVPPVDRAMHREISRRQLDREAADYASDPERPPATPARTKELKHVQSDSSLIGSSGAPNAGEGHCRRPDRRVVTVASAPAAGPVIEGASSDSSHCSGEPSLRATPDASGDDILPWPCGAQQPRPAPLQKLRRRLNDMGSRRGRSNSSDGGPRRNRMQKLLCMKRPTTAADGLQEGGDPGLGSAPESQAGTPARAIHALRSQSASEGRIGAHPSPSCRVSQSCRASPYAADAVLDSDSDSEGAWERPARKRPDGRPRCAPVCSAAAAAASSPPAHRRSPLGRGGGPAEGSAPPPSRGLCLWGLHVCEPGLISMGRPTAAMLAVVSAFGVLSLAIRVLGAGAA